MKHARVRGYGGREQTRELEMMVVRWVEERVVMSLSVNILLVEENQHKQPFGVPSHNHNHL